MTSDEKYIENHRSKRSPFIVPVDYFEHLSARVMDNAMTRQQGEVSIGNQRHSRGLVMASRRGVWQRYAASLAIFLVGGAMGYWCSLTMFSLTENVQPMASATKEIAAPVPADADISAGYDMADYTMLDNDQIYSLVASN